MSGTRILIIASGVWAGSLLVCTVFPALWFTPDQLAARALASGDFDAAVDAAASVDWQATALYRAGDLERAAGLWSGLNTPGAAFNRGNALVFLGKYDDAIASYDDALERCPGWDLAEHNRGIAAARRLNFEGEEGGVGKLGADEIVFDKSDDDRGDAVDVTAEQPAEGQALNELWLRNVRTEPADFLRLKFAAQVLQHGEGDEQ